MAVLSHQQVDTIRTMKAQGQGAAAVAAAVGVDLGEYVSITQGGGTIAAGDLVEHLSDLNAEPIEAVDWSQPATIVAPRGHVTSPTVPATTVAATNKSNRDAIVTVTGGTVTVIAVQGATSGRTSGSLIVPSGNTIAITYSAAPTWTWVLI
jgi:hypothetical protein